MERARPPQDGDGARTLQIGSHFLADWVPMSKSTKSPKAPVEQPGTGFGGLAAALASQGLTPTASADPGPAPSTPPCRVPAPPPPSALRGKAVVRQERKGRGGKTVTVVDGAAIARVADLDALAKTMRKALGTGARVEGGRIVLQGDQRDGASAWLQKQGATVVIGY